MSAIALSLSAKDVARTMGVSVRSVWRYVELGIIPEPIRLTRKLVRWEGEGFREWWRKQSRRGFPREAGYLPFLPLEQESNW